MTLYDHQMSSPIVCSGCEAPLETAQSTEPELRSSVGIHICAHCVTVNRVVGPFVTKVDAAGRRALAEANEDFRVLYTAAQMAAFQLQPLCSLCDLPRQSMTIVLFRQDGSGTVTKRWCGVCLVNARNGYRESADVCRSCAQRVEQLGEMVVAIHTHKEDDMVSVDLGAEDHEPSCPRYKP